MLYHVSIEEVPNGIFTPRIPDYRLSGENDDIKRICFSKSLEGAFSALPKNLTLLNNYFVLTKQIKSKPIFFVYSIDEKHIEQDNLISSNKLVKNNLVSDALITSETWVINQKVKCNYKLIYLEDFFINDEKIYVKDQLYYIYKISKVIYKEINKENLFFQILDDFWNKIDNIIKKNNLFSKQDEFYDGYKRDIILYREEYKNNKMEESI